MGAPGGLDEGVHGGTRQGDDVHVAERVPREQRIAEAADADSRIGLDDVEGADGAVAHLHPELAPEVAGVVHQVAVAREECDLLERDDIGVQGRQKGADRPEAIGVDAAPPSLRERPGADGGPDVPADDAKRRHAYLTEPASRPWTK